ncbi:hypothetical protein [Actinacidiphila acidipaludis]|uniref:Uncharacterized protein n=1 Tax=Actinacidiphila acidipaludis TaxID=2873382 RepID=A0ABS7Q7T1_9ACTN|nr:hypothetical protein [Streptomyces acidipaludis]MBY8879220.1 hypothetical protein [Streptomyces acidipaludis]
MTRRNARTSRRRMAAVAAAAVLIPLAAASPALAGAPVRPGTAASATAVPTSGARPPAALGGATAASDPAEAPGRVDQITGVPVVTGGADAVTTTFRATLPDGVQGPVSAQLAFSPDQLPRLHLGPCRGPPARQLLGERRGL